MPKIYSLIILFFFCTKSFAQSDTIQARIILIGDAGKLNYGRQPVEDAARNLIPMDKKTTIIFLGNNLYNANLPEDFSTGYEKAGAILDSQINIAKGTDARVVFIPGNHDWMDGGENGLENVRRQESYIDFLGNRNIKYIPSDGCPGPVKYDISKDVIIIFYDSQWFLQKGNKPGIESDCGVKTADQFYSALTDLINDNKDKLIIIAGHHTLKSYGVRGGYFTLKQHIFPFTDLNPKLWIPLPVIGSIYPIARGVFETPEDLHYPDYANMIRKIENITRGNKNVIFVAGHEHSLQLIKDSSQYFVVSGAGSKTSRVSHGKKTLFSKEELGFATLEISKNKNVHIDFYTVNKDSAHHAFSENLLNFQVDKKKQDSTEMPQTLPEMHFKDSVTVSVNNHYDSLSGFQKFIMGKNYRKEWATPVHLKVFRIASEMGGFTIKKLGSGKQTRTLEIVDKKGIEWRLETVDKDPIGAVADRLRGTAAQKIVQDLTSALHPFGEAVVPTLAQAAGVVHATPKYYFVPDDPHLGIYRQVFANKVCLLEQADPAPEKKDTKSTAKVISKMIEDSKNTVDQEAVLRARLLDMVIGDWDRQFDHWEFGTNNTGAGELYYPIPKDRDQAFFNSNGLLVRGLSMHAMRYLQGFKKDFPSIKWFNWEERDFDRIFMNNLDREKWEKIIRQFQQDINDTVIDRAVKQFPKEIYLLDSAVITKKLKDRRDKLTKDGIKYYRFLSKEVNVVGSNKDEYFKVSNAPKGLEVKVFKRKYDNDSTSVMFDRVFNHRDTKYINLYGLNGEDMFVVDSGTRSKIKLRIIGGQGRDTFNINGHIANKIYDYEPGKNFIIRGNRTKNEMSASPYINRYESIHYKYNRHHFPMINLGYNSEDKVLAGLGFSTKTYAFRKKPFATSQQLSTLFSPSSQAYTLQYAGEFNQIMHNNDLVVHVNFFNPVLDNFFGFGNNTVKDKNQPIEFYHVRYKYVSTDVQLRKKYFNDLLQVYLGPSFYIYWNKYSDNKSKILSHPANVGLDSASIFNLKSYTGAKFDIAINNLNSELIPSRGVVWNTELSSMVGINKNSHNITKIASDLTVYASLRDPGKLVAVLRFGGGHIFNDNYEYFQAFTLGASNYLRGFRKDRFSGQSIAYQTTELRIKLFESHSFIFPGAVGLVAFNEVGRVWVKNETSHTWHQDFGGGIYYSPYNFAIVSATIAHSKENNLFNFSIGTKFNLYF